MNSLINWILPNIFLSLIIIGLFIVIATIDIITNFKKNG
jgi:hypothetical protein